MTTPFQSLRARIRDSAMARKIWVAFSALVVAIPLVSITVIFLAEGRMTLASLVIFVPLWSLGVVAWVLIFRMLRHGAATTK